MDDLFDDDILQPAPEVDGMVILSVANAYKKQYYLNPKFAKLPETIQEELQIMCVLYTADVGGILTLRLMRRETCCSTSPRRRTITSLMRSAVY